MAADDHGKCCPNHRLPAMRNYSDWDIVVFWDKPLQRSSLEHMQGFCAQVGLNHSSWHFLFILSLIMNSGIWILFNLQKHWRMIFDSTKVAESCFLEIFIFISLELGKMTPLGYELTKKVLNPILCVTVKFRDCGLQHPSQSHNASSGILTSVCFCWQVSNQLEVSFSHKLLGFLPPSE